MWSSQSYVGADCPTIIRKADWDAQPTQFVVYLDVPTDLVIISHTVTQTCSDDTSCADVVRNLQKTHKEVSTLWDIGPSFLIASTGKVYEGRGWNTVGMHTPGYNNHSIGIAFIGNFNNQEPTQQALDACQNLLQCGIQKSRLTPNHKVVIHSQLIPTESPGKKLASKIRLFARFIEDVTGIKLLADVKDQVHLNGPEREPKQLPLVDNRALILVTPSDIDSLSNIRGGIKELIQNLLNLAIQTLNTIKSLTGLVGRIVNTFFDTLASNLKHLKDLLISNISKFTGTPGIGECINKIQGQANVLYDTTDSDIHACADRRIKEINDMINNLSALSSDAINYSNTAVVQTKNCTELNYGIEVNTKSCLNSISTQTQRATNTYERQRTLILNSIQSSIDSLPDALNLCAQKPVMDATSETHKLISTIPGCTAVNFFGGFGNIFDG